VSGKISRVAENQIRRHRRAQPRLGTSFWSQVYQRFDQIRLPNPQEFVAQFNPHQMLDAQRWFAAEAADHLRFQTNLLREHCGHRQWITTNHIHNFPAVNPALNARDFDVVSWTLYPVHGHANRGPLGFRLGDPSVLTFAGDFMRSLNGQHGIMELQPGQVNWGEVNPQPHPGAVHLWIMRTFATGAKFVCTYRYRQPRSGAELYHYGIVGPDGVTPTNGGEQFAQAARDLVALRKVATPAAPLPPAYAARRAAILYRYENRWDIDNHKQNKAWDTYEHLLKYHRALKRVGAPVDVLTEEKDFSVYPFLIAPAYQLLDAALVARWKTYAEAGGHLILTCRTGQKDRRGTSGKPPGPHRSMTSSAQHPFLRYAPDAEGRARQDRARQPRVARVVDLGRRSRTARRCRLHHARDLRGPILRRRHRRAHPPARPR